MNHCDFIGKTGSIAFVLQRQIPKLKDPKTVAMERRYLFTGKAGLGKSTLALELGLEICNGQALGVEQLNGQSMSVERVRAWQQQGAYHPMFGDASVVIVDEIDQASPAALNEVRQLLDKLPPRWTFIATTNKKVEELPEVLQSRFKPAFFEPVGAGEVKAWLLKKFNKLTQEMAGSIAVSCRGNVRAAQTDAMAVEEAMM